MYANLEKLKQVIRPTTAEEIRAFSEQLDSDEPRFVFALESDLRDEFLRVARQAYLTQLVMSLKRLRECHTFPPRGQLCT